MFCPNCGQQQVSEHTRFCSRCGLGLIGVLEFLEGRAGPAARNEQKMPAADSPQRRAIRRGAKLMFLSGVLAPICFGLCFPADSPGPLLIPISVFLAGLALLLYAKLFGEDWPAEANYVPPRSVESRSPVSALPPATSQWVNNPEGQRVRTAEIATPPSVTDRTTNILHRDEG